MKISITLLSVFISIILLSNLVSASWVGKFWEFLTNMFSSSGGDCTDAGGVCKTSQDSCKRYCTSNGYSHALCDPGGTECSICCCMCWGETTTTTATTTLPPTTEQPTTTPSTTLPPETCKGKCFSTYQSCKIYCGDAGIKTYKKEGCNGIYCCICNSVTTTSPPTTPSTTYPSTTTTPSTTSPPETTTPPETTIPPETTLPSTTQPCQCTEWKYSDECGTENCEPYQKYGTRTCEGNCEGVSTTRCLNSYSCGYCTKNKGECCICDNNKLEYDDSICQQKYGSEYYCDESDCICKKVTSATTKPPSGQGYDECNDCNLDGFCSKNECDALKDKSHGNKIYNCFFTGDVNKNNGFCTSCYAADCSFFTTFETCVNNPCGLTNCAPKFENGRYIGCGIKENTGNTCEVKNDICIENGEKEYPPYCTGSFLTGGAYIVRYYCDNTNKCQPKKDTKKCSFWFCSLCNF